MTWALFLAGPPDTGPPLGNQDGVGRRQIRGRVTAEDELPPDRPAPRRGGGHGRLARDPRGVPRPRARPAGGGLPGIPPGLPRRDTDPPGQRTRRLRNRHARLQQIRSRVDPPGVLRIIHAAVTSHAMIVLPDMSHWRDETPGQQRPRTHPVTAPAPPPRPPRPPRHPPATCS